MMWLDDFRLTIGNPTGINNVGSIAQALLAKIDPDWEVNSPQAQAAQVSIISMANCIGRILIGMSLFDLHRTTIGTDFPVVHQG